MKHVELSDLLNKTMKSVVNVDDEQVIFTTINDEVYELYHDQDCCENVRVEDVIGDLSDLVGAPILMAEETTSNENLPTKNNDYDDSFTWSFYKFATIKGYVTIRWYGSSNGYYSECVSFVKN